MFGNSIPVNKEYEIFVVQAQCTDLSAMSTIYSKFRGRLDMIYLLRFCIGRNRADSDCKAQLWT